jgi:hypothetical protein
MITTGSFNQVLVNTSAILNISLRHRIFGGGATGRASMKQARENRGLAKFTFYVCVLFSKTQSVYRTIHTGE